MKRSPPALVKAMIPLFLMAIALSIHLGAAFVLRHRSLAISAIAGGAALGLILHLGMLVPLVSLLRRRVRK
jgi:hypothetical protein